MLHPISEQLTKIETEIYGPSYRGPNTSSYYSILERMEQLYRASELKRNRDPEETSGVHQGFPDPKTAKQEVSIPMRNLKDRSDTTRAPGDHPETATGLSSTRSLKTR